MNIETELAETRLLAETQNRPAFFTIHHGPILADDFTPDYGDSILYIAFPPNWVYRRRQKQNGRFPARGRRA